MQTEVDEAIKQGRWADLRASHKGDAAALAEGAQCWCVSDQWAKSTPHLEDWKEIVGDLKAAPLSELKVQDFAASAATRLPFPTIPLFEAEQVGDFCAAMADLDAGAALLEILQKSDRLDLARERLASLCWEHLRPEAKANISETMWKWRTAGEFHTDGLRLPTPDEARILSRHGAVASRLAAAVQSRLEHGTDSDAGAAIGVADVLELWRQPQFAQWAITSVLGRQGPADAAGRLVAAIDAHPRLAPTDPTALARLNALAAHSKSYDAAWRVVNGELSSQYWSDVERLVRERSSNATASHPLTERADALRKKEVTVSSPDIVGAALLRLYERLPALVAADPARPFGPLPALDLVMAVQPSGNSGWHALAIVRSVSEKVRRQWWWWWSLDAALRQIVRHDVDGEGLDRYSNARRTISLHSDWLTTAEREAMDRTQPITVYAPEPDRYAIAYQRSTASERTPYATVQRRSAPEKTSASPSTGEDNLAIYLKPLSDGAVVRMDVSRAGSYEPPGHVFVIGWGNRFDEQPLPERGNPLDLKFAEHAIVPVDRSAEDALRRTLEGLKGLPIHSLIAALEGRAVESRNTVGPSEDAESTSPDRLPWLWVGLALVVGILVGGVGLKTYQGLSRALTVAAKPPTSPADTAVSQSVAPEKEDAAGQRSGAEAAGTQMETASLGARDSRITSALAALEEAVPNSQNETIKALSRDHTTDEAKGWLIVKIALLQRGQLPATSALDPGKANDAVLVTFRQVQSTLPDEISAALNAVNCRIQAPLWKLERCDTVSPEEAVAGLTTLRQFVLGAPPAKAPSSPAGRQGRGATPPPSTPEPARGRRAAGAQGTPAKP